MELLDSYFRAIKLYLPLEITVVSTVVVALASVYAWLCVPHLRRVVRRQREPLHEALPSQH